MRLNVGAVWETALGYGAALLYFQEVVCKPITAFNYLVLSMTVLVLFLILNTFEVLETFLIFIIIVYYIYKEHSEY